MSVQKRRLSWNAVRRGPIYCAPACGGQCTWAGYQWAKKSAAILARRMGKGWKPRVWENLGWHWSVISSCTAIEVFPNNITRKVRDYTAFLRAVGEQGGQWVAHHKDPRRAIETAAALCRRDIAYHSAILKRADAYIAQLKAGRKRK